MRKCHVAIYGACLISVYTCQPFSTSLPHQDLMRLQARSVKLQWHFSLTSLFFTGSNRVFQHNKNSLFAINSYLGVLSVIFYFLESIFSSKTVLGNYLFFFLEP